MAPTMSTTKNYSILSIPVYIIIAMAPHIYSTTLLTAPAPPSKSSSSSKPSTQGPSNMYGFANPRGTNSAQQYSAALPRATYERWERARAAHANMFENGAFFVSAVLAGVVTKCDAGYMNRMVGWYLLTRILYVVAYVSVSRGPLAMGRSVFYFAGGGILLSMWWEATKNMWAGNY